MNRILKSALATLALVAAPLAMAGEPLTEEQMKTLRTNLAKPNVALQVVSAETTGVPGLVEVQLSEGPIIYSTLKGDYFILGDLYSVGPEGYVNLAEQRRDAQRVERLADLKREDMIIFSPEKETRSHVTVFFDTMS